MLDNTTKKRIDDCRDVLVGKVPDPKSQIEQITLALIYKFMDDMDRDAVEKLKGKAKLGTLYWFIDDHYIGSTNLVHEFIVNPDKGIHNLHVTDEFGNAKTVSFEISEKSI